jgi:hypothetical protein
LFFASFRRVQISAQSDLFSRLWFASQEVLYSLLNLHNTSRNDSLRVTCASAMSHLMRRIPTLVNNFLDKVGFRMSTYIMLVSIMQWFLHHTFLH